MSSLKLRVLSLRYSSWSMRPWLALKHAGADFETETVTIELGKHDPDRADAELAHRRQLGSVTGLFPVLEVGGARIHESLAICEWAAESYPDARLWPEPTLDRALARAICCEMVSGFSNLRTHLSCHPFARVPGFQPNELTRAEIARVFEIWRGALERSGGPLLFGQFSIADAMYFPVVTRFRTYDVALPGDLERYARALEAQPAVLAWEQAARQAPRIAIYDDYVRGLGGDPHARG